MSSYERDKEANSGQILETLAKKLVKDASKANKVIFVQAQRTHIFKIPWFLMFAKSVVRIYVFLRVQQFNDKTKLFYCFLE